MKRLAPWSTRPHVWWSDICRPEQSGLFPGEFLIAKHGELLMASDVMLRGGRVLRWGSTNPEALDVRIAGDGRIVAIAPVLPDGDTQLCLLDGQLVLPGLVDMHQHLDKSRTRALVSNPSGTLLGASAAYRALAPSITKEQMIGRARRTVEVCSAYGTVA